METKIKLRVKFLLLAWLMIFSITPQTVLGQSVSYLNDKSKTYQLRSMENGKWEFHPGLYYITFHKKYSGGYWKGLNIRWDVKKGEGQIEPVRASEVAIEALASNRVQSQIDSIEPIAKEETIRSAERMVDVVYVLYESDLKKAFEGIDELTKIANDKSNGILLDKALKIIEEKNLLISEIDYIHESGPTKQMEQAKRQLAYEEVMTKVKKLYSKSYNLAYYAQTLYNLRQ